MTKPSFFAELKRRHVYKVGAMYAIGGWLFVQVVTQVLPLYETPTWVLRSLVTMVIVGFPIALVLSWVFDITPQGIVRTDDIPAADEAPASAHDWHGVDRKLNYLLGGLLVLALAYLAAERAGLVAVRGAGEEATSGEHRWAQSIAVLPFENLSDDSSNAYFASGIQDEILLRLSSIGDLKVISRTSTAKYKSHPDNLKTVAAELGVATLLEGSVQKIGDKVRVNVKLIDAHSDSHLWANRYDRDLKDIFAVETEISQAVVEALQTRLTPAETKALASTAPTQDAEAYDLFLKGEYAHHEASTLFSEAPLDRADAFYRAALARDPEFALAQVQLAQSRLYRQWFFQPLPESELGQLKSAIDGVVATAPNLPQAWMALGLYHYWGRRDWPAALEAYRRALALQPGNSQAHFWIGVVERRRGHWDQAVTEGLLAVQLDPRDDGNRGELGLTLTSLRRWSEAERELSRALALNPRNLQAASVLLIARVNGHGDIAGARRAFDGIEPGVRLEGVVFGIRWLVDLRVYLDVLEGRFDRALEAYAPVAGESGDAALRRLAGRVAIRVIAGQRGEARLDCEALRLALEPRQNERTFSAFPLPGLSLAYLCLGRDADAVRLAQELADALPIENDASWGPSYRVALAQICALAGQTDKAIKLVTELMSYPGGGMGMSVWRLKLDPVWDSLRGDPRFQKLIADGEAAEKAQPKP